MKAGAPTWLPFPVAAGIVIALGAPYTVLNTLFPGPVPTYALGLAIAALGLGALWLAGMPPVACFVRVAPLSRGGAWVLIGLCLYIPAVMLAGLTQPRQWVDASVYAVASALGQELYFRGALLAVLGRLSPARPWLAVAGRGAAGAGVRRLASARVPCGVAAAGAVGARWDFHRWGALGLADEARWHTALRGRAAYRLFDRRVARRPPRPPVSRRRVALTGRRSLYRLRGRREPAQVDYPRVRPRFPEAIHDIAR